MTAPHDRQTHALIAAEAPDAQVLADTLAALAKQVGMALDCSECCVYEYVAGSGTLCAQAIWGLDLTDRDLKWIGKVNRITDLPGFQQVIERQEVLAAYPDDEIVAGIAGPEGMAHWGELAALWAPVVHDGEVLGLLELTEKRQRREFTAAEQQLAAQMAALAGVAMVNARDSRAAHARNRQLTALIDSSRAMTSTLDLEEVLDVVCRQTALAVDAQSSYIYEYDADADTLTWLAHYQRDPDHGFEEPLGTVYDLGDMPQDSEVIKERHVVEVRLDDPDLDPVLREQLIDWEEQSSLMVPLVVGDDIVGALEVSEAHYPRHFSDQEMELCRALGEQAAAAIRNAQLYRRLQAQNDIIERQATTDGLTGLANHRHFFDRLRAEVTRSRRYGLVLSLLMLDLDDFKQINDRFGHPAGDRVLAAVSDMLRRELRADLDIPARYGGEEFAVILPHTATSLSEADMTGGARATGERIRAACAALELPLSDTGSMTHVSVSVGIAMLPAHATEAEDLVSKADQALYLAKRGGKDRVVVYRPK